MNSAADELLQAKIEAARRQLGTALSLFLEDRDPISVHCLAGGGCEVIEWCAETKGAKTFFSLIVASNPGRPIRELRKLQRQYWNSFKHATGKAGETRDDLDLLKDFDDQKNDLALFIGWSDYGQAAGKLPVEAQVFQPWFFTLHPEMVLPDAARDYEWLFPGLRSLSRKAQKDLLRAVIEDTRLKNPEVMTDPRTERRPLRLDWPQTGRSHPG